jgi:heme O synthase-like polyprenyltransferase
MIATETQAIANQPSIDCPAPEFNVASLEGVHKDYGPVRVGLQPRQVPMSMNSKKSIAWMALLIVLGLIALFVGAKSLIVLIPAAILVWYGAGPALTSGRN